MRAYSVPVRTTYSTWECISIATYVYQSITRLFLANGINPPLSLGAAPSILSLICNGWPSIFSGRLPKEQHTTTIFLKANTVAASKQVAPPFLDFYLCPFIGLSIYLCTTVFAHPAPCYYSCVPSLPTQWSRLLLLLLLLDTTCKAIQKNQNCIYYYCYCG